MASLYPGSLDSLPTSRVTGNVIPASDHNDTADAVNKIEAELGTNPKGSSATVKARLDSYTADINVIKEAPLNFTEPRVGGVGNDAADNDAAWTAVNTLLPSRGGKLFIPPGIFRYNTMPSFSKPIEIEGAASGIVSATLAATVLKPAAGVTGLDFAQPAQRSSIKNLYLLSQSTIAGTDDGIRARCHAFGCENVVIDNFGRYGLAIDTSAGGNANLSHVRRTRVRGNRSDGFYIAGVDSQAMKFDVCDASANGGWGFNNNGSACNVFDTCHTDANTAGAFRDSGSSCQFISPYAESGVGYNVSLLGVYALWLAGQYTDPPITVTAGNGNRVFRKGAWDSLVLGQGGTELKMVQTYNVSVDLPSIAANSTIAHNITTTAGMIVAGNDRPILTGVDTLEHGLLFQGCPLAPAADTIQVRVSNVTAAAINAAARTFYFLIVRN